MNPAGGSRENRAHAHQAPVIRRLLGMRAGPRPEIDGRALLERIPETAREVTGARFAALCILNERRDGLAWFLTAGLNDAAHRAIGHAPRGRGVLGALVQDTHPLRLVDVGRSSNSYGFPGSHPVMRAFLGVPVVMGLQVWGSLYLAETAAREFSKMDERCAVILAAWAAAAVDALKRPQPHV